MFWLGALLIVSTQLNKDLIDWALARAPHGVDVTLDGEVWVNIANPGLRDDYAILARDLKSQEAKPYPKLWVRGYHKNNPTLPYRESKAQYQFNCKAQTISTETHLTYDAQGNVKSDWRSNRYTSDAIVPGSIGARLYAFVCGPLE
jgi:hypothetical protein